MDNLNEFFSIETEPEELIRKKEQQLSFLIAQKNQYEIGSKHDGLVEAINAKFDIVEAINATTLAYPSLRIRVIESREKLVNLTAVTQYEYFISIIEKKITGFVLKQVLEDYSYQDSGRLRKSILYHPILVRKPAVKIHPQFSEISNFIEKFYGFDFIEFDNFWISSKYISPQYINSKVLKKFHLLFGDLDLSKIKTI